MSARQEKSQPQLCQCLTFEILDSNKLCCLFENWDFFPSFLNCTVSCTLLDLQIVKIGATSSGTDYIFQKSAFFILNSQGGKKQNKISFLLTKYCSGLDR
jgi:hypothetical protein